MTRGRGWLITHGQLRARKHVLPREVTLSVSLVKLGQKIESSGSEKSGGKTGQGFVGPSIVLSHDRLARGPNGCAEVIHHSDHRGGRDKMRLATKAGRATVTAVRSPRPPTVTPVVACHQE